MKENSQFTFLHLFMLPPSVLPTYLHAFALTSRIESQEFSQSALSGGDDLKLRRAKAEAMGGKQSK